MQIVVGRAMKLRRSLLICAALSSLVYVAIDQLAVAFVVGVWA
jgi:hypothetical protein